MSVSNGEATEGASGRNSGGAAAAAGLSFQALVGARIVARMLSETSIGSLFGLPPDTMASAVRFETEQPIDDIQVLTGGADRIQIQVKTSLDLSATPSSPLAGVFDQFTRQWIADERLAPATEGRSIAYVLAVSSNAPQSLRTHLTAGFNRARVSASLAELLANCTSDEMRRVLSLVVDHIRSSYRRAASGQGSDEDVIGILRLARLIEMPADVMSDAFDAERTELRARVLDTPTDPTLALVSLRDLCLRLCAERSGGDAIAFRNLLASAGAKVLPPPSFRDDIDRLQAETMNNLARESDKTAIRFSTEQYPADRSIAEQLWAQLGEQSVLVSGEPGCGKTGLLVQLAARWREEKGSVLFLSVDRHAVASSEDLRTALKLRNHVAEVLQAWDTKPGLLVIDALDAARGGEAERVYRNLIESVLNVAGNWTICASIRTFDLNNSRVFKDMARPFGSVRVTDFSPAEMNLLLEASPKIASVLTGVTASALQLLQNPFNLQLAVEVVELESGNAALADLSNQAALLSAYWRARLPGFAPRQALEKIVLLMIERESLLLQASDLSLGDTEAVQVALSTGVVVNEDPISTRIAFRHHILFDFAASLAKFRGDNIVADIGPLKRESGLGFVLAPALRFHLQRIWDQASDRLHFWKYVAAINGQSTIDPIARAATARAVAELVRQPSDVDTLVGIFRSAPAATTSALQEIMQEARLGILGRSTTLLAWAHLADALMREWGTESLYPIRLLLLSLAEAATLGGEALALTGSAARKYLRKTLSKDATPPQASEVEHALRAVAKTYSSNVGASRVELEAAILPSVIVDVRERILSTLSRCIDEVIDADPEFAATIYAEVFATPSPGEETTSLGNSQILSLTSTRRQDFESCFWSLGQSYPRLWKKSPAAAVQAAVSATRSHIAIEHPLAESEVWFITIEGQSFKLRPDHSFIWAAKRDDTMYGRRAGYVIAEFGKLLRTGAEDQVLLAIDALLRLELPALLWARVFAAGAERPALLGGRLWPLLHQAPFFECSDTVRDAVDFLEVIWGRLTVAEKESFERVLISFPTEVQRLALSVLPIAQLNRLAETKRALERKGPLEKPARTDFRVTSEAYDWVRDAGVSVDTGPNADLRAGIKGFEAEWPDILVDTVTPLLASAVNKLVTLIDRKKEEGADWRVVDEAWSSLAERLRNYFSLAVPPGAADFGPLARSMLFSMSQSTNPSAKEEYADNRLMSWGSPAPRLEAAAAMILAARQPSLLSEELKVRILALLHDDVPTVRLQIAQSLNVMWESDRAYMWSLIDDVAENEHSNGVLQFFIAGTLGRIMHSEPDRVGSIVAKIVERVRPMEGEARDSALEHAADVLCILWIWRGWEPGEKIIKSWLPDIAANEVLLWHAISQLREGLVAGLTHQQREDDACVRVRSQALASDIVFAAKSLLDRYHSTEVRDRGVDPQVRSAAKLLDHVVMEIYFASGAYSDPSQKGEPHGLQTNARKLQFLRETTKLLVAASSAGTVHTLHQLLEILEYLMPGAPEECIDLAFATVLDSAEGGGYAVEQMGADLFVRIIRTSLADHRDLYADRVRRARLLDALDRFLQAGNPEARRLLHELPDALR